MRYGVSVPNFGVGVDARVIAELAREAEEAGWDGFFLWDHLLAFSPGPRGGRTFRAGGSRGDAGRGPEGRRAHRGGLRGGWRHLVDREHRPLAFRVDGGRTLAVRRDAPSSAAGTARGMRHEQAPAGTVVATDVVSVHAGYDDGRTVSHYYGGR